MNDLEKAKHILASGEYTCVLVKGDEVITSHERGVAPLLTLLDTYGRLEGFFAADKTVGVGAAHLYAALGVASVYANVMSESAKDILESSEIEHACALSVPFIINRRGDGPCPIEAVLSPKDTKDEAILKIRKRLQELGTNAKNKNNEDSKN